MLIFAPSFSNLLMNNICCLSASKEAYFRVEMSPLGFIAAVNKGREDSLDDDVTLRLNFLDLVLEVSSSSPN